MIKSSSNISIIIPVLNEEKYIAKLLHYVQKNSSTKNIFEILVVDGGSTDNTLNLASDFGATVLQSKQGRAKQMNIGARYAKGKILYFLHADTFPPKNFDKHILNAATRGTEAGCFRMQFDSSNTFLSFFSWFSRINHKICRGGDQSLFVTQRLFHKTKGFNENYVIYEDSEFIGRLYKMTNFKVLRQKVITSARKYKEQGTVKLQFHFGVIHLKNLMGAGPESLYEYYRRKIAS